MFQSWNPFHKGPQVFWLKSKDFPEKKYRRKKPPFGTPPRNLQQTPQGLTYNYMVQADSSERGDHFERYTGARDGWMIERTTFFVSVNRRAKKNSRKKQRVMGLYYIVYGWWWLLLLLLLLLLFPAPRCTYCKKNGLHTSYIYLTIYW